VGVFADFACEFRLRVRACVCVYIYIYIYIYRSEYRHEIFVTKIESAENKNMNVDYNTFSFRHLQTTQCHFEISVV
jgi:hypothetical protein